MNVDDYWFQSLRKEGYFARQGPPTSANWEEPGEKCCEEAHQDLMEVANQIKGVAPNLYEHIHQYDANKDHRTSYCKYLRKLVDEHSNKSGAIMRIAESWNKCENKADAPWRRVVGEPIPGPQPKRYDRGFVDEWG